VWPCAVKCIKNTRTRRAIESDTPLFQMAQEKSRKAKQCGHVDDVVPVTSLLTTLCCIITHLTKTLRQIDDGDLEGYRSEYEFDIGTKEHREEKWTTTTTHFVFPP
jgi:hypothetical protein